MPPDRSSSESGRRVAASHADEPVDVVCSVVGHQVNSHTARLTQTESSGCFVGVERTGGRVDVVLGEHRTDRCGLVSRDGQQQGRGPVRGARVSTVAVVPTLTAVKSRSRPGVSRWRGLAFRRVPGRAVHQLARHNHQPMPQNGAQLGPPSVGCQSYREEIGRPNSTTSSLTSPRPTRCALRSQAIPPSRDSAPPSRDRQHRRRGRGPAARAAAAA